LSLLFWVRCPKEQSSSAFFAEFFDIVSLKHRANHRNGDRVFEENDVEKMIWIGKNPVDTIDNELFVFKGVVEHSFHELYL
jgi:hypothetical protein